MGSDGPLCWLDYYDTHVIMCAWYYTSCCIQLNCQMDFITCSQICSEVHSWLQSIAHSLPAWHTLPIKLSRRSQVHSRACSQERSQLHSMAPSQPAWLYAPNSAHKMLSSTLPSMLSSTLPIALDDTLLACLTVRFRASSQDAPNRTRWHTSSLLDCTLPTNLSRRSPLYWMAHSQPAWLYIPKYTLKTLPIALDGTLRACLTVRSQVSFQDAPKHTRRHTPSLLDCTFPSTLSRRSQSHSKAHSHPAWLYAL